MSLHEIRNKENNIKRRIKQAREESRALLEETQKKAAQIQTGPLHLSPPREILSKLEI